MAITGSGTEQDPYIVDNFAEFDTVRNISATTYVEYSNDEVDFNDIQPYGYTEPYKLIGRITFTNITFKNFTSRASQAFEFGTGTSSQRVVFDNCKIINAYYTSSSTNRYFFSRRSGTLLFDNCEISYRQDVGNAGAYTGFINGGDEATFTKCAITIKTYGNKNNTWQLSDKGGTFEFCNINLDIQANKLGSPLRGFMCWYSGKIDINTSPSSISGSGGKGNIVWDVEITQPISLSDNSLYTFLSIYNSDKATISATNSDMLIGVTSAELKDTGYLYSLGFPAR
jgi:hypothetical protein